MSRRFHYNGNIGPARSRGVVLFVALVFLILLTLLALSSSTNSLLQEKMVGSTRNAQMANFGAESALREAEARIWDSGAESGSKIFACDTSGSGVCYRFDPQAPNSKVIELSDKKGLGHRWRADVRFRIVHVGPDNQRTEFCPSGA